MTPERPARASPGAELIDALAEGLAPPRRNGELAFEQPWQSRAFGMAVGLHERGVFQWDEFRGRLIARIGAWDASNEPDRPYNYWEHWLGALQDVLVAKGVSEVDVVDERAHAIASRPAGADHGHDHRH